MKVTQLCKFSNITELHTYHVSFTVCKLYLDKAVSERERKNGANVYYC